MVNGDHTGLLPIHHHRHTGKLHVHQAAVLPAAPGDAVHGAAPHRLPVKTTRFQLLFGQVCHQVVDEPPDGFFLAVAEQ